MSKGFRQHHGESQWPQPAETPYAENGTYGVVGGRGLVTPSYPIAILRILGAKSDARYNCGQGYPRPPSSLLSPFFPNIVPAPESRRSVAALVPFVGVVARSFSFPFEAAFLPFRANRKSRFTQPLAERIEIPFQSKKSCKSAL